MGISGVHHSMYIWSMCGSDQFRRCAEQISCHEMSTISVRDESSSFIGLPGRMSCRIRCGWLDLVANRLALKKDMEEKEIWV